MVPEILTLFLALLLGHALADFPLQGDFLAQGKNRHGPLSRIVPWWICMTGHSLIHAGAVAYITGSIMIATLEFFIHWSIDFAKCEGWMGNDSRRAFTIDQCLHVACKVAWVIVATVAV